MKYPLFSLTSFLLIFWRNMSKKGLKERLDKGPVICAEGFLFEIERRGYMSSGEFVPMVSLDHPEALENLHRDFQHAGSCLLYTSDAADE